MTGMTIGRLAVQTGVAASTIRYWERVGALPKAVRVSGQRRYGPGDVDLLAVLRLAQACGFDLKAIRTLLCGFPVGAPPSERWQELARRKLRDLDEQMARLKAMRQLVERVAKCECGDLRDCGIAAAAAKVIPAGNGLAPSGRR